MIKQEQDKRWAQLSTESKKYFIDQVAELQRLIKAPSPSQAMRDEWRGLIQGYENVFGARNLQPKPLTYADMAKELFKGKGIYRIAEEDAEIFADDFEDYFENYSWNPLNCVSKKQAEKLLAINKLLNVAKYLNGDWKPDWENESEEKYFIEIWKDKIMVAVRSISNSSIVYFRTEELAKQAIQILGEGKIRLALSTDY